MIVKKLDIPDVLVIKPPRYKDNRGFFSETYNQELLKTIGINMPFIQDNQSFSNKKGIIRGMHCQIAPFAQGKLVRCTKGAIWDVVVDIRKGSATYGKWTAAEISEENWSQIWVPPGFLHGFLTLTDNTEVQYKCTNIYNKTSERSVIWNCPYLNILWPIKNNDIILSDKDMIAPCFVDVEKELSF